jgi:hypothetical protein
MDSNTTEPTPPTPPTPDTTSTDTDTDTDTDTTSTNTKPKPKRKRKRKPRPPLPRVAYSIPEWGEITCTSRPTIYRQMGNGELKYVQVRGVRRIPATELSRLGFVD